MAYNGHSQLEARLPLLGSHIICMCVLYIPLKDLSGFGLFGGTHMTSVYSPHKSQCDPI